VCSSDLLEHEPDVCFLDIRMPGLSGLEVARRIAGRGEVVFVTAHGDHALPAFDAGAVDYVLKPVEPARLCQAVQRVQARLSGPRSSAAELAGLLAKMTTQVQGTAPPHLQHIQVGVGREVRLVPVEDVVYFESDARYTRVVYRSEMRDGDALIRTPLKELLTQLDEARFWQVHRSVIVNQRHIAAAVRVDEGNMHLTLKGRPETLPVSRHFQGRFRAQ
jgi:DNA-binding LytR/AlgR family response regulator